MRRALAVILAIAAVGLGGGETWSRADPVPSSNVTAYDVHGRKLPPDPQLRGGDSVLLVVTGFAPSARVQVRIAGATTAHDDTADAAGTVHDRFIVLPTLPGGPYVLTFVGPGPADPASISGLPHVTNSNDDGVIVTVPNGGFFPFHIGFPSSSGSSGPTASVLGTSTSRGSGSLSATGANVLTPVLIALIALVAGVTAVRLGRRAEHQ